MIFGGIVMALIKCAECGKEMSDKAKCCPHCWFKKEWWVCPECNSEISLVDKVCYKCGYTNKINGNNKKYYIVAIGVIFIIIIRSCFSGEADLEEVFDNVGCDNYYCELADDGSYLSVDTNPLDIDDYSSSTAIKYVKAINTELGFTDALYTKMGKTRALDGTLTDENSKVRVSWTYHPDKGLSVVYYKK